MNQKRLVVQLNFLKNGQLSILKRFLAFNHTNLDEPSTDFVHQSHHHLLFSTNVFLYYQDQTYDHSNSFKSITTPHYPTLYSCQFIIKQLQTSNNNLLKFLTFMNSKIPKFLLSNNYLFHTIFQSDYQTNPTFKTLFLNPKLTEHPTIL